MRIAAGHNTELQELGAQGRVSEVLDGHGPRQLAGDLPLRGRPRPVNRITEILNGRRAATGDTALRLARFFGTSGEFWLNIQKLFELRQAEWKNGAAIARLPSLDFSDRRSASG